MKELEEEKAAARSNSIQNGVNGKASSSDSETEADNPQKSPSMLANVAIVTTFALFAWLVRCIIVGLADDSQPTQL